MGTIGSLLLMLGGLGAAGTLVSDPILGTGPLSWLRFGHGRMLATVTLYIGFGLIVWAWVRLGRYVLMNRVGARPVLVASACWTLPMLFSPPLFTRDVFAYLAQGAQLLYGRDPYATAPNELGQLPNVVSNVYPLWQTTPSPYGPLFLSMSSGVVSQTGDDLIAGVIVMRLMLLVGLAAVLWALPRLVRHLGGDLPIALWLAVASPMTVVHLIGGPHNDLMMLGFLTVGVVMALERKHVLAIVLVTLGMLTKPTAAIALPFLVWIWANHLPGDHRVKNLLRAGSASVAIFGVVFAAGTWLSLGSLNLGWVTGLEGPQMIKNWLNFPTGIGELVGTIAGLVSDHKPPGFVTVARALAWGALAVIGARQWWLARDGGVEAVRRMAITLLAVALLAPPTLPWYLTWGFVLASAFRWTRERLALVVAASVFLVLAYYPTGEQALYSWFIGGVLAISGYAAWSFLRPDPLGLVAAFRTPRVSEPARAEEPTAPAARVIEPAER